MKFIYILLFIGCIKETYLQFTFSKLATPAPTTPTTTTTTTVRPVINTIYGIVFPYSYTGNSDGLQQQVFG